MSPEGAVRAGEDESDQKRAKSPTDKDSRSSSGSRAYGVSGQEATGTGRIPCTKSAPGEDPQDHPHPKLP